MSTAEHTHASISDLHIEETGIATNELLFKSKVAQATHGIIALLMDQANVHGDSGSDIETMPQPFNRLYPTDELCQDHTVNPNGLFERGWVRDAPTFKEVLSDQKGMDARKHDPVFVLRSHRALGPSAPEDLRQGQCVIEDYTEAEALQDLDVRMGELEDHFIEILHNSEHNYHNRQEATKGMTLARKMRKELIFIGSQELQEACAGLADYWHARLADGKDLYLATRHHPDQVPMDSDSTDFITYEILRALRERHDPEGALTDRIHLVAAAQLKGDKNLAQAVQKHGLIFADDWTISANQLKRRVQDFGCIPRNCMEANLICAPTDHFTSPNVPIPIKMYFKRPEVINRDLPSITGSHGDTDYGFRHVISRLYSALEELAPTNETLPMPLLIRIARVYRGEALSQERPAERQSLQTLWERCADFRARHYNLPTPPR